MSPFRAAQSPPPHVPSDTVRCQAPIPRIRLGLSRGQTWFPVFDVLGLTVFSPFLSPLPGLFVRCWRLGAIAGSDLVSGLRRARADCLLSLSVAPAGAFRLLLAFVPTACAMGYGLVPLCGKPGVTSYGRHRLTVLPCPRKNLDGITGWTGCESRRLILLILLSGPKRYW